MDEHYRGILIDIPVFFEKQQKNKLFFLSVVHRVRVTIFLFEMEFLCATAFLA
jgi:hypothetical protein